MLTQNLRMLERNGLVERDVHPTVPPRVECVLTESGQGLRSTGDGRRDVRLDPPVPGPHRGRPPPIGT
jgi:DNA-binding HxlR family transcriptional regulator